jgi:Lrp/AsnC family transcriptional regulator, regulator for asnA, asnC and gidA
LPALDQIDRQIMQILNRNARTPSIEIARQVGVPERTVHNRIHRLQEGGFIQVVAVVNPKAFGYSLAVDIFCEIEVGQMGKAAEALIDMPEISYLAISTGDQDLSIQALFKDIEEMQDFITHKLHQVPGMRRTRTVLIPRIMKDTYHWLPPAEYFSEGKRNPDGKDDVRRGEEKGNKLIHE